MNIDITLSNNLYILPVHLDDEDQDIKYIKEAANISHSRSLKKGGRGRQAWVLDALNNLLNQFNRRRSGL